MDVSALLKTTFLFLPVLTFSSWKGPCSKKESGLILVWCWIFIKKLSILDSFHFQNDEQNFANEEQERFSSNFNVLTDYLH